MRIVYLARRPVPSRNANSVQIVKMCEAFARNGHRVTLLALPGDSPARTTFERYQVAPIFDIETHPARPMPLQKPAFLLAALRRFAGGLDADVYFGRDITSLAVASLFNRPVVYEAHVLPPKGSLSWSILKWLFRRRNFAQLICVTSSLADLYRRQFPALEGKPILVAPNAAADIEDSVPIADWPGRSGALQVGFVGRPFRGKGIETIAAAAKKLPDVDFHVVGARKSDISWIGKKLPGNLFLHGYRPHSELAAFYRMFDVAAAPYGAKVMNASGFESAAITSPLKLLEYMAAGLPTIVSDLPGVRDIVADGEFALLVTPGSVDEFAAAVRRLADDRGLRQRLGAEARRRYLERHTADARARAVLRLIDDDRHSDTAASELQPASARV